MPARKLTAKQLSIRARNRANAQKSTGPRTAAGKARSSMNALTHGLTAQSPRDAADVEDRMRRAEVLIATFEPESDFEVALVHRMAGAFQRLEKADHIESQALDAGLVQSESTDGKILAYQKRIASCFAAVNRYRASAQHDLFNAYRMLEAYRQARRDEHMLECENEA